MAPDRAEAVVDDDAIRNRSRAPYRPHRDNDDLVDLTNERLQFSADEGFGSAVWIGVGEYDYS